MPSHSPPIPPTSSAFNPQSLYSNSALASTCKMPPDPSPCTYSTEPPSTKKKQTKRRKVNLACIYCRRSHMTCDEGRPCQRCIKRDIGHLCHDESTAKPGQPTAKKETSPTLTLLEYSTTKPEPTATCLFTPFIAASSGPYSSASPMSNLNHGNTISPFNQSATHIFRDAASPLKTPGPDLGNLSLASTSQAGTLPGSTAFSPTGTLQNGSISNYDWSGLSASSGLGGAGWLGLGGPGGYEGGGSGFAGDSAGGNEFTLLSEFLESLDGPTFGASATLPKPTGPTASGTDSRRNTISGQVASATGDPAPGGRASLPPPASTFASPGATDDLTGMKRPRTSSVSAVKVQELKPSPSINNGPFPPSLSGASKTERFFLTAADQKDGPRDERLSRVIQAKYEAGLLRPYNHVNGYARLNRWMERNVSQASKRRILKPLSVFRPAFRAVAQSLTNIDLIFIEEAFERLLLDYDRVFSTQGIPACLWRRTGEIYKGNKEFAELVGVPIESLREGRLCIYELMAGESAVNYWEKYGAVSFDPGQKAVLTSCVLRTKNKGMLAGNKDKMSSAKIIAAQLPTSQAASSGQTTPTNTAAAVPQKEEEEAPTKMGVLHCCFSFTIRRDQWNIPTMIVGNFLPTNPP